MSPEPLPLAAASARLRKRPGRPRTAPTTGEERSQVSREPHPSIAPRLLDLAGAAAYLSLSPWTVRDLEAAGTLRKVRVPLPHGAELRKLLFDRDDLDRLIGQWKDA